LARIAHPEAVLISVDINLPWERRTAHAKLATRNQRVVSVCGDSRAPATLARVRSTLHGRPLDFLFIDGDHAYDAVKTDFLNYRPLVRSGGLIAFHDIVPDFNARYGTPTISYAGGVPTFWQEIKAQYRTSEFIEDPKQDGYGIGVVHL
jgi:predicted O-methyltransferase YrrM